MLAADGGSLLRPQYIDRALEIEEYLQYKLKGLFFNGVKNIIKRIFSCGISLKANNIPLNSWNHKLTIGE